MTRASHAVLPALRRGYDRLPRGRQLLAIGLAGALGIAGCSAAATPSLAPSTSPSGTPASSTSTAPAGASAGSSAKTAILTMTAREYAYDVAASAPAGPTTITLTNQGKEEHQAQLAKLADGVSVDQLKEALQNPDPSAALKLVTLDGGPNGVAPGATVSTTSNLSPGQYIFLCFVSGDDGIPHVAKGMLAPLQVTGSASSASLPAAEATVTAKDFSFDAPSTALKAGKHTLALTNNGPQPHEAALVRLAPGMTVDQIKQILSAAAAPGSTPPSGPPPWESAGGVGGVTPGTTVNFDVDVTAGNYAFVCFIPDPTTGKAHFELGMIAPLTVQ